MNLYEILNVEIDALCQTIIEYSTDIYVVSYAKQLLEVDFKSDNGKSKLLVDRIYEWYTKEIKVIMSSKYTLSVEAHQKSYNIIKLLKKYLDE